MSITVVYKHHNNTICLTIQYKAALTTCEHKITLQFLLQVLPRSGPLKLRSLPQSIGSGEKQPTWNESCS